MYRIWRPTPLMRAERFEQALGLKGVRIYYKYEGGSPVGPHKPNTAVPQAFYCAQDGRKRIATETGAGQWGIALAYATQLYGLECEVFMVGISYRPEALPPRHDGDVRRAPCTPARRVTNAGRAALEADPDRSARSAGDLRGRRARRHRPRGRLLAGLGAQPRAHAPDRDRHRGQGAAGGVRREGPRRRDRLRGRRLELRRHLVPVPARKIAGADIEIIAVEPASCPTLTRGVYAYDFGDAVGMAPLVPDAHAWPRLHAARASTRAACATTAWRRSSRTPRTRA